MPRSIDSHKVGCRCNVCRGRRGERSEARGIFLKLPLPLLEKLEAEAIRRGRVTHRSKESKPKIGTTLIDILRERYASKAA